MGNPKKSWKFNKLPTHIAIIMDGNGRWAKDRHLPRIAGHKKGAETVRDIVTGCREMGIKALTLYAFSEENWKRPALEISALMKLLKEFLVSERGLLQKNDIRLRAIGDLKRLPEDVQETLRETLRLTESNQSMSLVLALSYGGRNEILRAVQSLAQDVAEKRLAPKDLTLTHIDSRLDTAGLPDPDLLIRTSGEYRTSNFLPWQTIYTELFVTQTLWPDFSRERLAEAIADFGQRERRFGLTGEQLTEETWADAK